MCVSAWCRRLWLHGRACYSFGKGDNCRWCLVQWNRRYYTQCIHTGIHSFLQTCMYITYTRLANILASLKVATHSFVMCAISGHFDPCGTWGITLTCLSFPHLKFNH
jgi:hypothetical protein